MDSQYCFVITVTEGLETPTTHLDSIWLDEAGSYGRINELIRDWGSMGSPLNVEQIVSVKRTPHMWYWCSEDRSVVVCAERCKLGTPMLRWMDWPVESPEESGEVESGVRPQSE
jgi:hypothetical protein